jgi:hypothetical protein
MDSKINKKLEWEENWQTDAGAWIAGERVVMHGEDILQSLQGKTWMEMMLLAITGKMPTVNQANFLDEVLVLSGCIPDPRLWNNRIAALAGTARSIAIPAISAATSVSDAVVYGFQPAVGSFLMFQDIALKLKQGNTLEVLLSERLAERKSVGRGSPAKGKNRAVDCLPGYGRPVTKSDERIPPLMKVLERYNFHKGDAVTLAFDIEKQLQAMGYKLSINAGGLISAIGVDQKLLLQEFLHYVTVCFYPGLMVCYDDALKHPEGSFFPMRCEQIEYKGESERQWLPLS